MFDTVCNYKVITCVPDIVQKVDSIPAIKIQLHAALKLQRNIDDTVLNKMQVESDMHVSKTYSTVVQKVDSIPAVEIQSHEALKLQPTLTIQYSNKLQV